MKLLIVTPRSQSKDVRTFRTAAELNKAYGWSVSELPPVRTVLLAPTPKPKP